MPPWRLRMTRTSPVSARPRASARAGTGRRATNGGGGSGTGSPPASPATPDSTSAKGQPSARRTRRRSTDDRPPRCPSFPYRRTHEIGHRRSGLPATSGVRPAAVATAAASAPAPGTTPPSIGYVGSRLVATNSDRPRGRVGRARSGRRSRSHGGSRPRPRRPARRIDDARARGLERLDHSRARARRAPRAAAPALARHERGGRLRAGAHVVGTAPRRRSLRAARRSRRPAGSSCWS